ncbi:flagellar biosynthesis protein FliQ [Roseivivax marinus]|uniref:Flagellar biosynthetic protein FliQ n=1 Tax=Roseivivax marinus TaxID=1379903 RepID=W4HH34_9RHOB|nr:flagellar biosynthesis protein FliQ [Roseivivax marinus]ETW11446.1 flagellar biosynthesis protein FliQ [Roseivivax marinus]UMA66851.1 flagellar biosynthesis protein FliQ [Roseivivax marinus]
MSESEVYDVISDAIWVVLIASGPILVLALAVGLVIAFFQALTQIQEMTLTFVPKIVVIFVGLVAATPFMYATLHGLADRSFDAIASGAP